MGTNQGDKDNNSVALDQQTLTHSYEGDQATPFVTGLRMGGGLRGMEANVAESKGTPTPPERGSGSTHEFGVDSHAENLPECY